MSADAASRQRPASIAPRLVAITDRGVAGAAETLVRFERLARMARPFSVMFQLRDPELQAAERLAFGRELRALCDTHAQWLAVNDRCDLALMLGADALHLTESSIGALDARRVVGERLFVSRACHDPLQALEPGVDAWVLSPIFEGRKGRAPLGMGALERLVERCRADASAGCAPATVFALGGVTPDRVDACDRARAAGVAVIGAVLRAEPDRLVERLGLAR